MKNYVKPCRKTNSQVCVRAPGRVNLIGEHTDYNQGFVLPMAVDRYINIKAGARKDRLVKLKSVNFAQEYQFSLEDIEFDPDCHWANYFKGVAFFLLKAGCELSGLEVEISGDVPVGSGLSSSAAIEVASCLTLVRLNNLVLEPVQMIKLCQQAENEFVGVGCGIMDQFVSMLGRSGHLLLLDCRSLEYEYVPLSAQYQVVVCDTGVERRLSDSEYNRRRSECNQAVEILKKNGYQISSLRDISVDDFQYCRKILPELIARRAEHIVYENQRVLDSQKALRSDNFEEFGRLMNLSHQSLKRLYEVSCRELDLMVEIARTCPGVLGSRMTGAGFGGCTVNLVRAEAVDRLRQLIETKYYQQTGIKPTVFVFSSAAGAWELCAGEKG